MQKTSNLQEQLNQRVMKKADKNYYENHVVLYQRIFEEIKEEVNQLRRAKNYDSLVEKQKLAYFVLQAKAKAWALRSKEEFINQLDDNLKKQRDLSYNDNPYTELYIKYLLEEKQRLGYL